MSEEAIEAGAPSTEEADAEAAEMAAAGVPEAAQEEEEIPAEEAAEQAAEMAEAANKDMQEEAGEEVYYHYIDVTLGEFSILSSFSISIESICSSLDGIDWRSHNRKNHL